MMQKNRIVVMSGILVLLATAATAAASYNVQTAKAKSSGTSNLGQNIVSPRVTTGVGCPIGTTGPCNTFNPNGNGIGSFSSGLAHAGQSGKIVSCAVKNFGQVCP
jgi:hypothetical protein